MNDFVKYHFACNHIGKLQKKKLFINNLSNIMQTSDNIRYTYDALDRLVEEYDCQQSLTTTYTYDSLGNRLSKKDSHGLVTYICKECNQLGPGMSGNGQTNYTNKRQREAQETVDKSLQNY